MAKETAEQKLLKIIETTQKQEQTATRPAAAEDVVEQMSVSVKGLGMPNLEVPAFLKNIINIFKGQPSGTSAAGFGLGEINRILMGIIIFLVLFFVFDFLHGMRYAQEDIKFKVDEKIASFSEDFLPGFKKVTEYLSVIGRRNIFQPFEVKEGTADTLIDDLEATAISLKTKDLKLVGISWLNTPESASALIENTTNGVTYFLREGEVINDVKVKEIYADSVILSYQNEEMEIRL